MPKRISKKKLYALVGSLALIVVISLVIQHFSVTKVARVISLSLRPFSVIQHFGVTKAEVSQVVPTVKTYTIQMGTSTIKNTYSGAVRGFYESPLAFQVSGKVSKRYVDSGSVVHAGDVLLDIDSRDIEQAVAIASAQLDTANSKLKLAENTLKRNRELLKADVISQAEFDQTQDAYDSAQAAARLAEAQYNQSVNQLNYCSLRTDRDGVVTAVNIEVGQVVAAGVPVVVLSGDKEVEISVPENQVEEIRKLNSIKVGFWALPNVIVEGKIREVAPSADNITRTYKVRVALLNPPDSVKLGMTATVNVMGSDSGKVVRIPLAAIYQTGDSPSVWVVQNDAVTLRPVKLGNYGDNTAEVLEGLQEGDIIVTAGVHKLQEGQKVNKVGDQQ